MRSFSGYKETAASGAKYRETGYFLIISIVMMLFLNEWTYDKVSGLPFLLLYISRLMGFSSIALFFFFFMPKRGMKSSRSFNRLLAWWAVFAFIIVIERFHQSLYDTPTSLYHYAMVLQWPLWGWIGFCMGQKREGARWLLRTFAAVFACVSLYSFVIRHVGGHHGEAFYGAAGWPVRLCMLFGFCWYMWEWVAGTCRPKIALMGLAMCSLETIAALHKPIVFSAICSMGALLLYTLGRQGIKRAYPFRLCSVVIVGAALLFAANAATGGSLASSFIEDINVRYIDVIEEENMPADADLWEKVDHASAQRLTIWADVIPRFFASPIVGSGLDQSYQIRDMMETISLHNGYLDWLLSFGLIGFAFLFFFIFIWYAKVGFGSKNPSTFAILVPCVAYITGIAAFNLGGMTRLFSIVSFFICFIMGIALGLLEPDNTISG